MKDIYRDSVGPLESIFSSERPFALLSCEGIPLGVEGLSSCPRLLAAIQTPQLKRAAVEAVEKEEPRRVSFACDDRGQVELVIHPVFEEGEIVSLVVVEGNPEGGGERVLPVTSGLTSEAEVERAELKRHRLESLGVLAGDVSHELNNLFTVLIGTLGLIEMQVGTNAMVMGSLKQMELAVHKAANLNSRLLSYSGESEGQRVPLSLTKLVRELTPLLKVTGGRAVRLKVRDEAGIPLVEAERGLLQQVIVTLVANTRRLLMGHGGDVGVRVGVCDQPEAATWGEARRWVFFEVTESVGAVSLEDQRACFTGEESDRTIGGMSLVAVSKIVGSLGGVVEVERSIAGGTLTRVVLPSKDEVALGPGSTAPMRVLVVDNDPAIREITRNLLEELGHKVEEAASGHEALRLVARAGKPFDGVLLDMNMPGESGSGCFDALIKESPGLSIAVMTGSRGRDIFKEFGERPISGYLLKPFYIDELISVLGQLRGDG